MKKVYSLLITYNHSILGHHEELNFPRLCTLYLTISFDRWQAKGLAHQTDGESEGLQGRV